MTPNEKLAAALETLRTLQERGQVAIPSADLTRSTREVLLKNRFLQPVIKGWYVASHPGERPGDTTSWYAAFWGFYRDYLEGRFGSDWILSPEQSLRLQAGDTVAPAQLLVRSPAANNQPTTFLHGTSLFETRAALPDAADMLEWQGLRLYRPAAALILAQAVFFEQNPLEARTVLSTLGDASELLARLLAGGHSVVAGRLAGAFRNIGRDREAQDILETMRTAGYEVRETDPFRERARIHYQRDRSPYVHRIRTMWAQMREAVIGRFPQPASRVNDIDAYLAEVDGLYVTDAYHSLSIEGYTVSPELIERVRSGQWTPQADPDDRRMEDALAARGYWQAFQAVRESVREVVGGANPGAVADRDHQRWYREMFAPKIVAGLLRPENLAGYRNGPVYLKGSRHVPLNADAVRDAMPAFFTLLTDEPDPAVRIVLGHFIYVYIHPYFDGNGRTGRFLMNVMMAAGGYPWTVIPKQSRADYMAALEAASTFGDIGPFTDFLAAHLGHAAITAA